MREVVKNEEAAEKEEEDDDDDDDVEEGVKPAYSNTISELTDAGRDSLKYNES